MMKRAIAVVLCASSAFVPWLGCGGSDDAGINSKPDSGGDSGPAGKGGSTGGTGARGGSGGKGGSSAGSGGSVDGGGDSPVIPTTCSTDDDFRPAGLVCDPLP